VAQVVDEVEQLAARGFRSILLVAGEHPEVRFQRLRRGDDPRFCRSFRAFCSNWDRWRLIHTGRSSPPVARDWWCIRKPTTRPTYEELHTAGPKKKFFWRMDTAERAYEAGFRRLGIGALIGLHDWRFETMAVAAHALYLTRRCWKAQISVSLPRMRPAAGGFSRATAMSDREFVQAICALRLLAAARRDRSCRPGESEAARRADHARDHQYVGRIEHRAGRLQPVSTRPPGRRRGEQKGEQFHISDERPPHVVAEAIRVPRLRAGLEGFDQALVGEKAEG
jgi:2-iminoacetate synthase